MHVRVKKVVAENLREKNLHTICRQPRNVDAGSNQRLHVIDGDAVYAFHDHDGLAAILKVDLRHID